MAKIKVGIFGAHSTGKSTFLRKLEAELGDRGLSVKTMGSLAAEARSRGFPILTQHTFESTLWLMARGISLELEHKTEDVLLVDRPPVDALGYQLAAFDYRNEKLDTERQAYLFDLAVRHCSTYDNLIYSKVARAINVDTSKPRDSNEHFRAIIDQKLCDLAKKLPHVLRLDGTAETEAKVLNAILSALH